MFVRTIEGWKHVVSITRDVRNRSAVRVGGRQESLHHHLAHDAVPVSVCLLRVHGCLRDQNGRGSARRRSNRKTAGVIAYDNEHPHVLYRRACDLVPPQRPRNEAGAFRTRLQVFTSLTTRVWHDSVFGVGRRRPDHDGDTDRQVSLAAHRLVGSDAGVSNKRIARTSARSRSQESDTRFSVASRVRECVPDHGNRFRSSTRILALTRLPSLVLPLILRPLYWS